MSYSGQIFIAILLDLLFGDPPWLPHPVRGIGKLCASTEKIMRSLVSDLYLAGLLTVLIVLAGTFLTIFILLQSVAAFAPFLSVTLAIVLLYTTVATKDLLYHSNTVYRHLLPDGSLIMAREAIAMIVGRDTNNLSQPEVTRACVETVAENMVDGVTAPLFYAVIASFAAPFIGLNPIICSVFGAFIYKAINTMDSMIGYKNEKYLQFGRVAAKLDDAANYFPARISGLCIILAAFFLKLDYREAARIFRRDRLNHSSPNAGHTEAATAGALGLRLGGPSSYFGRIVQKPYLGDSVREPVPEDIKKTNSLMLLGSLLFLLLMLGLRLLILY
jgi:adenosylcobinamide-phosphate synthase